VVVAVKSGLMVSMALIPMLCLACVERQAWAALGQWTYRADDCQ